MLHLGRRTFCTHLSIAGEERGDMGGKAYPGIFLVEKSPADAYWRTFGAGAHFERGRQVVENKSRIAGSK